ncbi:SLC7A1.2 family protein [Megaselia abdita]
MPRLSSYWKVLTRRKTLSEEGSDGDTKLNRVMSIWDLTALGVGSTLGAGVYVLAGQIAREQAGPSVCLSFAVAALASLFAGLCYAEFGARVPKAGSAYVYSYVCIGEFAAFVIGWNLLLEYVLGASAVCRAISLYLDTLVNKSIETTFTSIAPMCTSGDCFFAGYFDFLAFGLAIFFGAIMAFGVNTSKTLTNICTVTNILVLIFVVIAGAVAVGIKYDDFFENWKLPGNNSTEQGSGHFFPFGWSGMFKGAATSFFGFVGFDCIATTGEEVKNPRKNIPKSIMLSLVAIFLCYFFVSAVVTLMLPYYEQDINAPLPYAFESIGKSWEFAKWIVTVGGLIGLFASLFGALFPIPRVIYSMAEDGLVFRCLGKVHQKLKTPIIGTIFSALLTGGLAGIFDLQALVNMLSIGTLLAYTMVAVSVVILRYMDNEETLGTSYESINDNQNQGEIHRYQSDIPANENSMLTSNDSRPNTKSCFSQLFNFKRLGTPTNLTTRIVGFLILLFCIICFGLCVLLVQGYNYVASNEIWAIVIVSILTATCLLILLSITVQPREKGNNLFRVPWVPLVPAISIFVNVYLMLQLDYYTWIRFGLWMVVGKFLEIYTLHVFEIA